MSVQSSAAVRGFGLASALSPPPQEGFNASFDARWAAWIERGSATIGVPAGLFFGLTAGAR